jgi:putative chitinase
MQVTLELLQKICPKTKTDVLAKYVQPINTVAEHFEINTPQRMAAFLAQTAHESGGFNFIKENLNYSADGLQKIFKKYFPTPELAQQYARQPEKIANRVYAARMGNGDEASGDGWKFCGRGVIQLTGKFNYTKLAESLEMNIDDVVKYLETPEGAVASAGWFWDKNKLNAICDKGDFVLLTKRINGGTIGLQDRQHHYDIALQVLAG